MTGKFALVLGGGLLIFAGGWLAGQLPLTAHAWPQLLVLVGSVLNIVGALAGVREDYT